MKILREVKTEKQESSFHFFSGKPSLRKCRIENGYNEKRAFGERFDIFKAY